MQFWKIRYPQRFYLYLWHLIGIPHFSFNYFEKILTQEVMFHFGSITFNDTHPGKHLIKGCLYYKTIFGYKVTFDVSFYIYICILYVYIYIYKIYIYIYIYIISIYVYICLKENLMFCSHDT